MLAGAVATVLTVAAVSSLTVFEINLTGNAAVAVTRGQEVLNSTNALLSNMQDAETGQRGFILTGRETYLDPYTQARGSNERVLNRLRRLVAGRPSLERDVSLLQELSARKMAELARTIELRRAEGVVSAVALVNTDQGKDLMDQIRHSILELVTQEEDDLAQARATQDVRERRLRLIVWWGSSIAGSLILIFAWQIVHNIRQPLKRLSAAVDRIAAGDLDYRVNVPGQTEFGAFADVFNRMTGMLAEEHKSLRDAERGLEETNMALVKRGEDLKRHNQRADTMAEMTRRMQGCRTEAELAEVVQRFVPQILDEIPGCLFLMNNSQNLLRESASWGSPGGTQREFPPVDCWAIRRGQPHWSSSDSSDVRCSHVGAASPGCYGCIPMIAQGDVIGLLCLERKKDDRTEKTLESAAAQFETGIENMALAVANLRLRETLRNQSIRDSLTGLFNRRYLEETLELDLARASRASEPVACMMIDIDHFKRFNDDFGHDSGDVVLREVSQVLHCRLRKGDFACRYGGEEFTLIFPLMGLADAVHCGETIREAAKTLYVTHRGQTLGPITLSIGIACYPEGGDNSQSLIASADAALLDAKRAGRDRVMVSGSPGTDGHSHRQVVEISKAK